VVGQGTQQEFKKKEKIRLLATIDSFEEIAEVRPLLPYEIE
jgi:hypothetical protein